MKNAIWAIVLLLIGILVVSAVWTSGRKVDGEVVIGAAMGLTGYCASWGEAERRAVELAVAEANAQGGVDGKTIRLIVEDAACESKAAVSAVTKLIDVDQVSAIVGPTWGDAFPAVYPIVNSKKVVTVSPSMAMESLAHEDIAIDHVFSTWFPQQGEIDALQTQIAVVGKNRVIVLHDEDLFGTAMVDLFKERAKANDIEVVKEYTFPIGYDDFRTSIVELKTVQADGIFAVFQDPATKAKFYKQAKELGLSVQFFSLTDVEDETLVKNFAGALESVIYTRARITDEGRALEKRYREAYGDAPLGLSAHNAYDATNAVIEALRETNGSREGMLEAIKSVRVLGAVTEEVSFDENHQIVGIEFDIKTVRNGEFVKLQ